VRLVALDLSLAATGLFSGDPEDPVAVSIRAEIGTPSRRTAESDVCWNARRFSAFSGAVLTHLRAHPTELLVLEVTSHAHQWRTRGQVRTPTSRGEEFRAGLGLGRALGWIDGVLVLASAYGCAPTEVATIEAKTVKLRVAGAEGASKAAVKDHLARVFGWDTTGWQESEVDALAVGVAYLREREYAQFEASLRQQATATRRLPPRRRALPSG
jgi:hypothetical protein